MNDDKSLLTTRNDVGSAIAALAESSRGYGLSLAPEQLQLICDANDRQLERMGRIEIGPGILPALLYAFSDSPIMNSPDCADTLCELLESFYYIKDECENELSDEELLDVMSRYFNENCHCDITMLNDATLTDMIRGTNEY